MNIHDLQQALLKTTKILAGEELEVYMEGFAPRVEYDPTTKKPTKIFIPALPEGAPEGLIKAIHGYIDHECSHVMFSDADDICDTTKNKLWHYVHNCIEDPRVNAAISDYYLGSGKNIKAGYDFLFYHHRSEDGTASPYDKEYVDALDLTDEAKLPEYHMQYSSLWFAKQMGDELSGHKYDELDLDRIYNSLESKMDSRYVDLLSKVKTTRDVKNLTEYFHGFFSEEVMDKMEDKKPERGEGDSGEAPTSGEDDFKTMEDQLADAIKKHVEYGVVKSELGYYWSDRFDKHFDKHTIIKDINSRMGRYGVGESIDIAAFDTEVRTVTNYLTKDLRRLLEERRRRYYIGGYKGGKLNNRALFSVKLGNDRIFKKKNEVKDINAAVSLLIDMSGSMSGNKVKVAMLSAYSFAAVLDTINVPYEVYGFTTENPCSKMTKAYHEFAKGQKGEVLRKIVNECSPENFYAFKEFNQSFDIYSKQAMVGAGSSFTPMIQNEDSKHVKKALERLSARPERIKSLFVFSDGQPAFHATNTSNGIRNLKYYADVGKSKYGVDVYGIGIQSSSVTSFYDQHKVIKDLKDLPSALFEFLRKAI